MLKFLFLFMFLVLSPLAKAEGLVLNEKNTVSLNDYVTDESVQRVVMKARELDRLYPDAGPIYLVIHSGGGSIEAGIELINNLKVLHRPVHTVTIFAASMAFHTVQSLGIRYVVPMATLMQHKAKGGFQGEFPNGSVDSQFTFWSRRVSLLEGDTAKRAHYPQADLARKFDNEYWCNAQDCIKERFADKLVSPECDESLSGTYKIENKKYVDLAGGGIGKMTVTVEFAKCPLQTGPIGVDIQVTDLAGNPINSVMTKANFKAEIDEMLNSVGDITPRMWFATPPVSHK